MTGSIAHAPGYCRPLSEPPFGTLAIAGRFAVSTPEDHSHLRFVAPRKSRLRRSLGRVSSRRCRRALPTSLVPPRNAGQDVQVALAVPLSTMCGRGYSCTTCDKSGYRSPLR